MSLRSREDKIRKLVPSITTLITKEGRMTSADVRSPSGNTYHISLPDKPKKVNNVFEYGCSCHRKHTSFSDCLGNSNGTVCYHSIATLIARAERLGYVIEFPSAYEDVRQLAKRINGCVIKLKSNQGTGAVWLVAKKVLKKDKPIVSAVNGIEMMRGGVKEID